MRRLLYKGYPTINVTTNVYLEAVYPKRDIDKK